MNDVYEEIIENRKRLDACTGHEFVRIEGNLFHRSECKNCKGHLDTYGLHWYLRGRKDAIADRDHRKDG